MPWNITKAADFLVVVEMNSNKMNVMDHKFLQDWEDAMNTLEKEYPGHAVVLKGNNKAFSAGLDLKWMMKNMQSDVKATIEYVNRVDELGFRLFSFKVPVVAAITGHAIAGGFLLAACCDYRVSDGTGTCGLNEIPNGLVIPFRMLEICQFALPSKAAAWKWFLSGHLVTLKEAADPVRYGLVDELVEDPKACLARALEKAGLSSASITAYGAAKHQLQERVREVVARHPDATRKILGQHLAGGKAKL